jgi:uroporphyrinogen decarboxylase
MSTHRKRMEACLAGKILDRAPVALWRHFPVDDQSAETLAEATLNWQKIYDWDLIKVTPSSSFCLRDWGVEDAWTGASEGTRGYTRRVITKTEDWARLPVLEPDAPHLAAQLACLSLIRKGAASNTPIIQTIFSPLAQAKNLVGGAELLNHIRQDPEAVKRGLEIIAENTRRFIEAAVRKTGIDGIFYAVQHAQAGLLSEAEFFEFGRSYDLPLLEAAKPLWLNLLHLHGTNVYFEAVADYPVQIINWHDRDTPPSLAQALDRFQGVLCGGLSRETIVYANAAAVQAEAANALEQTNGRRLLLGTGCVVPIIASHGNLMTTRKSVENK